MRWLAAATLFAAACDRSPAIRSCEDKLGGVWITPSGARWMVLDHGATLEAFTLFDDGVDDGAPRVIDLQRRDQLAGEVRRRYMRGGDICEARAPARITACRAHELELVIAVPPAPLSFAPCRWPAAEPSRVERWRREKQP